MNDREDSSTSKSSCWDTASLKENWPKENAISYWRLFSFCTPWELFLLFIGLLMSIIKALTLSAVVIIYSEFTAMLVDRTLRVGTSSKTYALPIFKGGKTLTNASIEENNQELYNDSISYGFLLTIASLIMLVTGIFSVDIFNMIALRQVTRIRMKLFQKVMRQDIGWHDTAMKRNFTQNMIDDIEKIRDGISEKVAHFFYLIFGFIITVAISFAYGWKLTLAVSVYIPIVICLNYFVGQFQSRLTLKEHEAYSEAGNLVEEVLSSIRTVVAFGGEMKESQRYDNYLIPARKASQRKGAFSGLTDSVLKSMLFLSCAGAFWYGVNLILNDRNLDEKEYTPAILMIAFFGIIIGADNIARTSPFLESFAIARGCASTIFRVIDSTTKIDPLSTDGKILNYGLRGDIEFTDVYFRYPCRPDVIVHCGLNLKIRAGQTVALVGPSGCGKTTCIQLLQRFYDPLYGSILLDDFDLRKYNIQWLRSNMAVVAQESILFRGTIAENISYGKPKATQKEIEEAAKAANIHDFISNLPESYGTLIGGGGSTELSGGQKQRIAIARALIQNPKILLLDEATSALDYHSEKLVQDALDLACRGRTTIIVSHRLSTIRKADKIAFLHEGKVIEEGTHDELMILEGAYYNMIKAGEIQIPSLDNIEEKGDDIAQIKIQNSIALEKNHLEIRNESNSAERKANNYKQNDQINSLNHCNKDAPLVIKSCEKDKPNICATFGRILKMAKPEWCFLILGTLCAIGFGFTYPGFSIVFGEFYAALAEIDENVAFNKTAFLSICCLVLGLLTAVAAFMQTYLFHYAGIWLTTRMRSMTFKTILKQEIAWFEEPKNAVGSLSARLAGDASDVQSAIGYPLSGLIQAISNFIISSTLCFYYSWKLTLLCLTTCPVIVGSVIFEAKYMTSTMLKEKEILENACRLATDSVINIRTIAGLRREQQIINEYNREIRKVEQLLWQKLKYRGIINSTGQSFLFFAYAIALCYGGVLVSENQIPFQDIIKVSEALLYGSMMLAQSLAFAPAFSAALVAGHRLFQILDRKPLITSPSSLMGNSFGFTKQLNNPYEGIRYHNIDFRYSSRPDVKVLNSFNLEIPQGFTVALIGPSGSGKSTCLHLLQRYYDAENGSIHINNDNIYTDIGLNDLRYQLSIVSQEPILFQRSIAENIAYGDNMRDVSMSEIIAAAKSANAHDFITTLPYGYDTRMGARGSQLSGGQKQRLAIARALIRNPRILLLDEATSALDTQSEQLVQQALDGARAGRTCIIIAHRLATIQNANLICVLHNGQILEAGNHQQLLEKNGLYAKLHQSKLPQ